MYIVVRSSLPFFHFRISTLFNHPQLHSATNNKQYFSSRSPHSMTRPLSLSLPLSPLEAQIFSSFTLEAQKSSSFNLEAYLCGSSLPSLSSSFYITWLFHSHQAPTKEFFNPHRSPSHLINPLLQPFSFTCSRQKWKGKHISKTSKNWRKTCSLSATFPLTTKRVPNPTLFLPHIHALRHDRNCSSSPPTRTQKWNPRSTP